MKKAAVAALLLASLLCSCRRGPEKNNNTETDPLTTVTDAVTADTGLILSAAGFHTVRDDALGADWVIPDDAEGGLSARLLVYDDGKVSLRVTLEGGGELECGGKTYAIRNGDVLADDALLSVLRSIDSGADAAADGRALTDKERDTVKKVIRLYDASYGAPYITDTRAADVTVEAAFDENGDKIYECDGYSVRFPSVFYAYESGGELYIVSDSLRLRTVVISYTDIEFNPNLADADAAAVSVASSGGTLITPPVEARVGGSPAYRLVYSKDGVYVTQFFVEGGGGTYVLTGASYDPDDRIPANIISTFKAR